MRYAGFAQSEGLCLAKCEQAGDCRPGYLCDYWGAEKVCRPGNDMSMCMKTCSTNADCAAMPGYSCYPFGPGGVGVCIY